MQRIESASADQLRYEETAGSTGIGNVLIGLIGGAIGTFFALAKTHGEWGWAAIPLGIGGLYALGGLVRMARHSHLLVDRRQGMAEAWEGAFLPGRRTFQLAGFRGVEVACRAVRRGRQEFEYFYPISLLGLGAKQELVAPRDATGARRAAEEIALLLGFELVDSTSGLPRHYRADEVGVPLGDRLRTETPAVPPVILPAPQLGATPGVLPAPPLSGDSPSPMRMAAWSSNSPLRVGGPCCRSP